MATPVFGNFPEFVVGQNSSWEQYIEQLEFNFEAHGITDTSKQRALLLSKCGQATYSLIRSILTPKKPSEVSYTDIVKAVKDHVTPKPSEIVQRFKFFKRDQMKTESIADYVAELRRLSEHCNFGQTLDNMLRDRLVCGLCSETYQRKLLGEVDLTFKKALDFATAAEAAQRHTVDIRSTAATFQANVEVNTIRKNGYKKSVTTASKETVYTPKPCFRCGGNHNPDTCRFLNVDCRFCSKRGHIEKVCLSKGRSQGNPTTRQSTVEAVKFKKNFNKQTHAIVQQPMQKNGNNGNAPMYFLNQVKPTNVPTITVTVRVNGVGLCMEVDSGSAFSIVNADVFFKLWPSDPPVLSKNIPVLRTWSHQKLMVLGIAEVTVDFQGKRAILSLVVIEGSGVSLLGRDWFHPLGITVCGLNQVQSTNFSEILLAHSAIFQEDLGSYRGPPVHIGIKEDAQPKFLRSRTVPFAIRPKVDEELDRLVEQGILEPVKHSVWATPIVPVIKKDGSLRICGDYKSTVNPVIKQDTYPLPNVGDLLATLAGGTKFTRIDLAQAYQQLEVDETSSQLLTINTQKGLFKVKRLPFGISSSPSIFQREMDTLLAGTRGSVTFLDDILVSGTDDNHDERVEEVLSRLDEAGLKVQKAKCEFGVSEIEFLGFKIDRFGVHPTNKKVEAIHNAPDPRNKTELKSFLGLLNFYGNFLKGKATLLEPLHRLLDDRARWEWKMKHKDAFEKAKLLLQSSDVLTHYDGTRPLVLAVDASSYGVGAVLSHEDNEGLESPVAYASRTMSKTERNYAQIDREALAIIYGVSKFHKYLYGRQFKIVTDHKPLLGLFHPAKRMPDVMSPRMLRWSLLLASYSYTLEYRPGKEIGHADALSRLPVSTLIEEPQGPADILLLECDIDGPVDAKQISETSKLDPVISRVLFWTLHGWLSEEQAEVFKPFSVRKNELSVHKECLLWGTRVVVPSAVRETVMTMLHAAHPWIDQMKGLARSYVWWPGIDADVETCVKRCQTCQASRCNAPRAPIHSWKWPEKPWSRLHVDFAGPFQGHQFLLVVDAHSKWLEVLRMTSLSSNEVIIKLRQLFATHGLPDVIVSDNGTAFTSKEFKDFLHKNGILGTTVAPYHPSSNGQAERVVQTTKQAMRKIMEGDWETRLSRFLLSQHTIPHTTTGVSPAELLMKRKLSTALDRLHPDLSQTIKEKQEKMEDYGSKKPTRVFEGGTPVYMKNFSKGDKWISATIKDSTGPVSYRVQTSDGCLHRRHVDQLRSRLTRLDIESSTGKDTDDFLFPTPDIVEDFQPNLEPPEHELEPEPVRR